MRTYNQHRQLGNLIDVCIEVQGHKIYAHKIVLAASSNYFMSIFRKTNQAFYENKNPGLVNLDHLNPDAVELIVNFIYTWDIEIQRPSLDVILEAASYLQMDKILGKCDQFMIREFEKDYFGRVKGRNGNEWNQKVIDLAAMFERKEVLKEIWDMVHSYRFAESGYMYKFPSDLNTSY